MITFNRISVLFFIFSLILLSSCRPDEELVTLELPPTPVLTSDSLWGVANKPYLKVLGAPNTGAELNGLLRQGDIVEIVSKVGTDDGRSYWLEIISSETDIRGWIPDHSMDIYDSPAQARTAQSGM